MGTPRLQVMRGRSAVLDGQIEVAQTDPRRPDKRYKDRKQPEDVLAALEYLAAFDPRYRPPEKPRGDIGQRVYERFQEKKRRRAQRARAASQGRSVVPGLRLGP
jgi:hypothetical protein